MNCPDCGNQVKNNEQKYCEYCGKELIKIDSSTEQRVDSAFKPSQFKRRCC
ncbi:MAG: hypothetical protein ACFFEY_21310 [Candidatus Thorarchaeota archaeon]